MRWAPEAMTKYKLWEMSDSKTMDLAIWATVQCRAAAAWSAVWAVEGRRMTSLLMPWASSQFWTSWALGGRSITYIIYLSTLLLLQKNGMRKGDSSRLATNSRIRE